MGFYIQLKSLQLKLTFVTIRRVLIGEAADRYLINEIVTGEESDLDHDGNRCSHFELYITAMEQSCCDDSMINRFLELLRSGYSVKGALSATRVTDSDSKFVQHTFSVIEEEEHVQAVEFTFGREYLIPGMFVAFVRELHAQLPEK